MEVVITALGPDNVALADPIIHHVTSLGARIAEIQMYDHDEEQLFAMLCRISIDAQQYDPLAAAMRQIGDLFRQRVLFYQSRLAPAAP